jgi:hypothetical protein
MDNKNKIESRLQALGEDLRSQESVVSDVMDRINRIPASVGPVRSPRDAFIWRFMMNKYTKIAAAAAILIVAAVVTVTMVEKSTPSAYALEQTIAAFQNVRFVHVNDWEVGKDQPMQIWMEYGDNAEPIRIRLSMPEWKNPLDGPKEAIWAAGVAQVYMPKKNVFVTIGEKRVVAEMRDLASALDAGDLFRKMAELQATGKRKVEIAMPSASQDKIVITSTGDGFTKRFYVDPASKLLVVMETYAIDDKGVETLKYKMDCDYNRPESDPFVLQVPDDIMKVDLVHIVGGIPQGDMTDTQIAIEVVRQFWQACIDGDYQKAGGIYSGIAAETLKKGFGQTKVTKVLSIGEPTPNADRPGVYDVSNTVEFTTGQTVESKTFTVYVRKGDDPSHPNNWMIIGGI